jgi:hypothetical protein
MQKKTTSTVQYHEIQNRIVRAFLEQLSMQCKHIFKVYLVSLLFFVAFRPPFPWFLLKDSEQRSGEHPARPNKYKNIHQR